MSGIFSLPTDLLASICKKLAFQDVLRLGMTCHRLHLVAISDDVWMEMCNSWKEEIELQNWRRSTDDGKALFRFLYSFDSLIGTWSSQDLSPRGALLYVTRGDFSVVAWKVLPESLDHVSFIPLFEVIGCSDGSSKVELVSSSRDARLPATFMWSSPAKVEFHLEVFGSGLSLPNLLFHGFAFGSEDQRPLFPPSPGFNEGQLERGFGQRAVQYLRRLASFHKSRSQFNGFRYTYRKIQQPRPEHQLAGLWSGHYGPHGLEIVSVTYDENRIVATKILGDPNVPCNEVTFHADLSTASIVISPELLNLANMLVVPGNESPADVVTVFSGEGRIAEYNFRNPQWVPGLLLLHRSGNISFLWKDVNFVIRFTRLDLRALFNNEEAEKKVLPKRL